MLSKSNRRLFAFFVAIAIGSCYKAVGIFGFNEKDEGYEKISMVLIRKKDKKLVRRIPRISDVPILVKSINDIDSDEYSFAVESECGPRIHVLYGIIYCLSLKCLREEGDFLRDLHKYYYKNDKYGASCGEFLGYILDNINGTRQEQKRGILEVRKKHEKCPNCLFNTYVLEHMLDLAYDEKDFKNQIPYFKELVLGVYSDQNFKRKYLVLENEYKKRHLEHKALDVARKKEKMEILKNATNSVQLIQDMSKKIVLARDISDDIRLVQNELRKIEDPNTGDNIRLDQDTRKRIKSIQNSLDDTKNDTKLDQDTLKEIRLARETLDRIKFAQRTLNEIRLDKDTIKQIEETSKKIVEDAFMREIGVYSRQSKEDNSNSKKNGNIVNKIHFDLSIEDSKKEIKVEKLNNDIGKEIFDVDKKVVMKHEPKNEIFESNRGIQLKKVSLEWLKKNNLISDNDVNIIKKETNWLRTSYYFEKLDKKKGTDWEKINLIDKILIKREEIEKERSEHGNLFFWPGESLWNVDGFELPVYESDPNGTIKELKEGNKSLDKSGIYLLINLEGNKKLVLYYYIDIKNNDCKVRFLVSMDRCASDKPWYEFENQYF